MQGGAAATLVSTTYASTDEDIYAVENAYAALEEALNAQINSMESAIRDTISTGIRLMRFPIIHTI